jgi:hypothetical protein
VPSLVVIVVMECSPLLFVSLGNPERFAVSAAKAVRGSAPAATIAVPPINNSRRVSLVIERFSSTAAACALPLQRHNPSMVTPPYFFIKRQSSRHGLVSFLKFVSTRDSVAFPDDPGRIECFS